MAMSGLLTRQAKGEYEIFDVGLKRYIQLMLEEII
jgi:hypothetical protein